MLNKTLILAYDGDNAGKLVGRAILADDPVQLSEVSQRINLGHEIVQRWVQEHGGAVISGGGDEGTFQIPEIALQNIEELRSDYQFATNLTMTVGVGSTLSEAGKSLIVGKFRGKNQVVQYGPDVDAEIAQSAANVEQGNASFEEQKLGQAYLKPEGDGMQKEDESATDTSQGPGNVNADSEECDYCDPETEDCPYCAENTNSEHDPSSDGHDPDCSLCAEMNHDPSADGHDPDCEYCAQNAAEEHDPSADGHDPDCELCAQMSHNPEEEDHDPDCEYCAQNADPNANNGDDQGGNDHGVEATGDPNVSEPTTTSGQNFAGVGLPEPNMSKPDAISQNPDGLGTSFDDPSVENLKLQSEQSDVQNVPQADGLAGDAASDETAENILAQIDAIPGGQPPADLENPSNPDDSNMAVGTNMQDGVSRPENYDSNVPGAMGLSEDDESTGPDMTSVLQEGLDSHADNIQQEKVIQMVGQALDGFKACKDILERSQQQAPQLYQSSLMMLKAMIEMAKMLGLDQAGQDSENPLEGGPEDGSQEQSPQESAPQEQSAEGNPTPKKALGQ